MTDLPLTPNQPVNEDSSPTDPSDDQPSDDQSSPPNDQPSLPPLPPEPPAEKIEPEPADKSKKTKIALGVLGLFLLIASVPAAVYLVQQRQEIRKMADECPAGKWEVAGRVYCQDPGGTPIPIENAVVHYETIHGTDETDGNTCAHGTHVNSTVTTDSAGYYEKQGCTQLAGKIHALERLYVSGVPWYMQGPTAVTCESNCQKEDNCPERNCSVSSEYRYCKLEDWDETHEFNFKYTNCSPHPGLGCRDECQAETSQDALYVRSLTSTGWTPFAPMATEEAAKYDAFNGPGEVKAMETHCTEEFSCCQGVITNNDEVWWHCMEGSNWPNFTKVDPGTQYALVGDINNVRVTEIHCGPNETCEQIVITENPYGPGNDKLFSRRLTGGSWTPFAPMADEEAAKYDAFGGPDNVKAMEAHCTEEFSCCQGVITNTNNELWWRCMTGGSWPNFTKVDPGNQYELLGGVENVRVTEIHCGPNETCEQIVITENTPATDCPGSLECLTISDPPGSYCLNPDCTPPESQDSNCACLVDTPTPTPIPEAECLSTNIYHSDWTPVIITEGIAAVEPGQTVYFATQSLEATTARFRIKIGDGAWSEWLPPTDPTPHPTYGHYLEYTIPSDGIYTVESEVCASGCDDPANWH